MLWPLYINGVMVTCPEIVTWKILVDFFCKYFDVLLSARYVIFVVIVNFDFFSVSGTVISGYQVNNTYNLIGKGNPQWPQAFYPIENNIVIQRDDFLVRKLSQPKSWRIFNTTWILMILNLTFTFLFCRLEGVHITPQEEAHQPT